MRAMNLLAIETSTELGSIALWREGELLRRACPIGVAHSETLLPLIRATLHEAGLRLADLNAIAFAAGPGSFTGLRVACGVAQGLAVAHQLPVVPVGTLEAMALSSAGQRVIVVLDARMGEVYYACYADGVALAAVAVAHPSALPLPESTGWLACGNGLKAYPLLRERLARVRAGVAAGIDARRGGCGTHRRGTSGARGDGRRGRRGAAVCAQQSGADGGRAPGQWWQSVNAVLAAQVEVLPLSHGDIDEMLAVERRIYPFPWTRGNFVDSIAAGYSVWGCRVAAELIGYFVLMLAVDEAHLLNLSVSEKWQGAGFWRVSAAPRHAFGASCRSDSAVARSAAVKRQGPGSLSAFWFSADRGTARLLRGRSRTRRRAGPAAHP
jgi:tRNA threonylcarbamoyladenosine biosynthesis protein TsaB